MTQIPRIKTLTDNDMQRVHEATLKIMNETGIVMLSEEARDICKNAGCRIEGEIVHFPGSVVENALKTAPSEFTWTGRNPERAVTVGGDNNVIAPNLGPVFIQDMDKGRRHATLMDFANIQKICQASDVIDAVGSAAIDVADIDGNYKHLYMLYETIKNSDKPIATMLTMTGAEHAKEIMKMLEITYGRDFMDNNHVSYMSVSPLSPLAYDQVVLENVMVHCRNNQVVNFAPAIMGGLTGPVTVFGTTLLNNIEAITGIVFTQLVKPGIPAIYGSSSTIADMRKARYNAGSPLEKLITISNVQMARDFYHLPTRTMCGITESKDVDFQAGMETMQNISMGLLCGTNILYECLGILESIMTVSYEKMMLDIEIIDRVRRLQQGVETTEEELSVDIIQEIGARGSYLMHEATFEKCRNNWMPSISNWDSYAEWQDKGFESIQEHANLAYKKVLANAPETMIDSELDKELTSFMSSIVK